MPLPTPPEIRPDRIVQLLPKTIENQDQLRSLTEFLSREVKFWQSDLLERRREANYYLDWSSSLDESDNGEEHTLRFRDLVQKELPSLQDQLMERVATSDARLEPEEIVKLQKQYHGFCKKYDQLRLDLLSRIEMGDNFTIF